MNHIKKIGCGKVDCHGHGDYAKCGDLYMGEIYICSDCESKQLKQERDSYRNLCAELLNAAKNYLPHMPISSVKEGGANRFSGMLKASDDLKDAITKAEQLLGEKK